MGLSDKVTFQQVQHELNQLEITTKGHIKTINAEAQTKRTAVTKAAAKKRKHLKSLADCLRDETPET